MNILYTTHCPKCNVLKEKLDAANIDYCEVDDVEKIAAQGIDAVPVLQVNDIKMSFSTAVEWLKNRSVR